MIIGINLALVIKIQRRRIYATNSRFSHSPAFRADERLFAKYEEAERMIQELAMRQRGVGELTVKAGCHKKRPALLFA